MTEETNITKPSLLEILRSAGETRVKNLLPHPLGIWWSDHSTGCQITIWAKDEDGPLIEVWRLSTWYSRHYEFNESGKVRGLQPGCEWAKPAIDKLFDQLRHDFEIKEQERAERTQCASIAAAQQRRDAEARYAAMLQKEVPQLEVGEQ